MLQSGPTYFTLTGVTQARLNLYFWAHLKRRDPNMNYRSPSIQKHYHCQSQRWNMKKPVIGKHLTGLYLHTCGKSGRLHSQGKATPRHYTTQQLYEVPIRQAFRKWEDNIAFIWFYTLYRGSFEGNGQLLASRTTDSKYFTLLHL